MYDILIALGGRRGMFIWSYAHACVVGRQEIRVAVNDGS